MSTKPWMKFFPSDWRSDPALRRCTIAARGLWIEMLCLMHEADPYGELNVKGVPLSDVDLSRMVGIGLKECRKLLAELAQVGVSSTRSSPISSGGSAIIVYSRRMVSDHAKALKDRENGKTGGNPRLTPPVNPKDKAHILEARSQREEAPSPTPPAVDRDELRALQTRLFDRFPAFANRAASSPALLDMSPIANLMRAGADIAQDIEPTIAAILSRPGRPPTGWAYFRQPIEDACRTRLETKPILAASTPAKAHTWMNPDGTRKPEHDGVVRLLKRSFTDSSSQSLEPNDPAIRRTLRAACQSFRDGKGWDTEAFGSPPGHPACLIPQEIVEAILNPPAQAAE